MAMFGFSGHEHHPVTCTENTVYIVRLQTKVSSECAVEPDYEFGVGAKE